MKNTTIIKFVVLLFGVFSFASCKKFLEEKPKSNVTVENFYQTEGDAISAVNSYIIAHFG
jgi:starch-binding outer membrane protein, SusD/RagB family